MALLFLGKLFIAIGLCFLAYVLYSSPEVAAAFNAKLAAALTSCDCLPIDMKAHALEHGRMAVVGMLGCLP